MTDNGRLPTDENGKQQRWLGLTLDATDEQARAAFRRKHGYPAALVVRDPTIVKVGPIGRGARESDEWTTTAIDNTDSMASAATAAARS